MAFCGHRTFCANCGDEMIHRDHRGPHEASSALNQIIHREAPAALAVGDIDTYVEKWRGDHTTLRLLEHKQPDQPLGRAQAIVLGHLDAIIGSVVERPVGNLRLDDSSGLFIVRGHLRGAEGGRRKVDFAGPQTVEKLDGTRVLTPQRRSELWDWLNGGPDWEPRAGRGRWW